MDKMPYGGVGNEIEDEVDDGVDNGVDSQLNLANLAPRLENLMVLLLSS